MDAPFSPKRSPVPPSSARRSRRVSKFSKESSRANRGKSILDDDWKTVPATVVPKSSAKDAVPDIAGPMIGVWKQKDDSTDDSKWAPMNVIVEKEVPKDLAPDEPHGAVGVKEDAKPTAGGKLRPEEVVFYPPGDEPGDDVKFVGTWRTGKLNSTWPPSTVDKSPALVSEGKLKTDAISEELEDAGVKAPTKVKEDGESGGSAGVAKKSDEEEQKLEDKSNDKDEAQAPEEDNMVPKTNAKSDEAVEESKPAAAEGETPKPRPKAMRASMSVLSNTAAKPRPKATRASMGMLNQPKVELMSPATAKRVGKLKLPAAFSGK